MLCSHNVEPVSYAAATLDATAAGRRKPWTACSLLQLSALSSLLLSNSPSIPRPLETTNNRLPNCPHFGSLRLLELSLIRNFARGLTEKRGQKERAIFVVQFFLSARHDCSLTSPSCLQFQIFTNHSPASCSSRLCAQSAPIAFNSRPQISNLNLPTSRITTDSLLLYWRFQRV